jgi:hypothetical protein
VRRFTLLTLVVLTVLLIGAAAVQLVLASRGDERYPGPATGTELPTGAPAP